MLLVGLDDDAICTQRYWPVLLVQTVPYEFVFPGRACGTCDGTDLILVSTYETPYI